MGLGVENSVNAYNQNYRYQQNKTTGQVNHLDFNKILSAKRGVIIQRKYRSQMKIVFQK